jgi:hypothetical protein
VSVPSNQLFLPPAPPYGMPAQQPYAQAPVAQPPQMQMAQQPQPRWTGGTIPSPPQSAPAPVVRFQNEDPAPAPPVVNLPAPPAPVTLPAPEALGVRVATAAPVATPALDWNAVKARLDRLGAIDLQVTRLPLGGHRAAFLLPTTHPDHTRHVLATAATEADAVLAALTAAEKAAAQR